LSSLFHQDVVVAPLGSGSRGNATYIGDGRTGVLIDCGLSARQIMQRMSELGLEGAPIQGVLLTHEHADHVAAAGVLQRQLRRERGEGPEFFATPGTAQGIPERCRPDRFTLIEAGTSWTLGGLRIEPIAVPHDTVDPVCFTVASGNTRVGVVTDLGTPTRLLVQQVASLDVAVLEFNHDVDMLLQGDYPWSLKQRIRSHHGHLSNVQGAALLREAARISTRLKHVFLAHLSEENNRPEKAMEAASEALHRAGRMDIHVTIAEQDQPTTPVTLRKPLVWDTPRAQRERAEPSSPSDAQVAAQPSLFGMYGQKAEPG
jgi:phosphoribosyl 1,2-cyclic phosphodiesterase